MFREDCGVALIEQPFPVGQEPPLQELRSPIPIAADEAVQVSEDLPRLVGRFHAVNIKLDKCGGLTEGLHMAAAARALGLEVMIGNMVGTSLAMAPAYLVGQSCQIVDLDGPLLLASDRADRVSYEHGYLHCDERSGLRCRLRVYPRVPAPPRIRGGRIIPRNPGVVRDKLRNNLRWARRCRAVLGVPPRAKRRSAGARAKVLAPRR
jgi:hypothetical protein